MLQDFTFKYVATPLPSLMIDEEEHAANGAITSASMITLFTDRCVMCSRCVRFTREISGSAELQIVSRGHHSEIDIFPGEPVNNKLAGNVVDLCPVGALCSKDFLYKQRVWFLKSEKSVCPDCSTGCSIFVDHNKDIVYRLRPRENPQAQGHFMCDEGRFDIEYINNRQRLEQPLFTQDGKQTPAAWERTIPARPHRPPRTAEEDVHPAALGAVISPQLTVEEAYLLSKLVKDLVAQGEAVLLEPDSGRRRGREVSP